MMKDICYKQRAQFCSICSPNDLSYYEPANWSFR